MSDDTMRPPARLMNWNFVLLWQGQFVSYVGTQAFLISMIFWMKHQTGSATWVGMVTMAVTLPAALLGPLGGAVADRFSRRGILVSTDLARGLLSLALAALVLWVPDRPQTILVGLLATAFLTGTLGAFFRPAITAAIPDLVPPGKVAAGNSLMNVSMNASGLLGQAVGGVLFRLLGPGLLFIFNGLSYLFSGVSECFIRIPQKIPEASRGWRRLVADVRRETMEGVRYIRADRGLGVLLLTVVNDMVMIVSISVLFPFYVEDHLEASPDWFGYLGAAFAASNALGALLAGTLKLGGRTRVRGIVLAGFLAAASGVLLGNVESNWQALAVLSVAGAFIGFNDIHMLTAIQTAARPDVRGRVLGLFSTVGLAATPLAAGLSGVVTDLLQQDIGTFYALCGAGLVLTPLILLASPRARTLLAYEKGPEVEIPADERATIHPPGEEDRKMKRVAKILAAAAAGLLVLLAAAVVYHVRRPWPQTAGRLVAAGLEAPVEVLRDEWGVPHVYAQNERDLFFAQGYVHAQDRLWQMHMSRAVAGGRLAALFGEAAVDNDRAMRVFGLRWAAERDWELLDEELRGVLEAYSAGVNAYIDANGGHLGLEFRFLGVEPEPWTPVDSLGFTKLLTLFIALNSSREAARVELRSRLGEELGAEADERILGRYPDDAPVIVSPAPLLGESPPAPPLPVAVGAHGRAPWWRPAPPPAPTARMGRAAVRPYVRAFSAARPEDGLVPDLRQLLPVFGATPSWGSNAWVVHGSRTASGKPLLANDPHLGLGLPSVWYENGLHGGGFDVVGFSFPGLPTVVTGHNGRVAWGITSLVSDTQDFFIEELDDDAEAKRYRYQGEWRDLEIRRETIEVKGGEPVEIVVRSTHHGPIVNEAYENLRDEPPMALAWVTHYGDRILRALVDLDRAVDWDSFRGALSFWDAPSLSFVYADVDGNIGYQATGRHPIRAAGHDGSMPVPGWTGEYDWREFIPRDRLPWALNPPSGTIVTANNKTVSDDYPYVLTVDWADPGRARRINDLLAEGTAFTREDMARIQADTYSVLAEELRPYLLDLEPASDLERLALEEVRQWDLRFEPDRVGAAVFFVWQWRLYRNVVADELGDPEKLVRDTAVVYQQHSTLDEIMARAGDPWFDDRTTPQVETREDMVRRSLTDAVAWLREEHGEDPGGWRWGKLHPVVFTHQPLGQTGLGWLDRLFNSDELGGHGTSFTVFATAPSVTQPFAVIAGTSQRFIADLADLGSSLAINSTGQCAHLFHRHREDQIPLWQNVDFHPVRFSRGSVEGAAKGTLTLTPR